MKFRKVLFDPWSLGDALIAASVLRVDPQGIALACDPRWHPLLRLALQDVQGWTLLPVDMAYTRPDRRRAFEIGQIGASDIQADEVLNIRGDLRDYWVARKLYPRARLKMSGWFGFAARRLMPLDLPFAGGVLPIRNRYRAWAELAGVDFAQVEESYRTRLRSSEGRKVLIHVGALWKSRQYPHVVELRSALQSAGHSVTLMAGPMDALPAGVGESDVTRATDAQAVELLRAQDRVLTNDSGPMHLAAFLGCAVWSVERVSNIDEWRPPGVMAIRSKDAPKGYRPDARYTSDEIIEGWPTAEQVIGELTGRGRILTRDWPSPSKMTSL